MKYLVLTAVWFLLASCERTTDPLNGDPEDEPRTPLAEVGEILAGDKPTEEEDPVDLPPVDPVNPAVPVAKPVPDKPGFVISPYNGKWIDVTGVAPGELMVDPHFPDEKKYFRVPEPVKPVVAEEEVAPVEEPVTTPDTSE